MAKESGKSNVLPANVLAIGAAKVYPSEARTEYRIDGVSGLVLRCGTGGATFYFYYTAKLGKLRKLRKVKLGMRGVVTLADAKDRCLELGARVARGEDPAGEAKESAASMTFRELVSKRLDEDRDIADTTRELYRNALLAEETTDAKGNVFRGAAHVRKLWEMPATEVTPAMVVRVLDKYEGEGHRTRADHVKAAISGTYRWAKGRKLVSVNPAADLSRRASATPRTRTFSSAELVTFMQALDDPSTPVSPAVRSILKLALHTGQRRTECAGVRVSELQGLDGPAPLWVIAGDENVRGKIIRGRSKNAKAQRVPLSRQAALLFREAVKGAKDDCVFPADQGRVAKGAQTRVPHIHGESISKAMRRVRAEVGLADLTTHDLRRAVATWAGDSGIRPDVIDAILSHKPRDVTRLHYNHSTLDTLVRNALQGWADHLDRLRDGEAAGAGSNVVQLASVKVA